MCQAKPLSWPSKARKNMPCKHQEMNHQWKFPPIFGRCWSIPLKKQTGWCCQFPLQTLFQGDLCPLIFQKVGDWKGGAGRRSPVILWFNLYDVTLMVAMSYRALRWFGGEWSLVEPYWKEHGVGWKRHQGHLDKRLTYTTSCGNFPLSENHAKKFTTSSKLLLCLVLQLQGLLWRYVLERAPLLRSTAK